MYELTHSQNTNVPLELLNPLTMTTVSATTSFPARSPSSPSSSTTFPKFSAPAIPRAPPRKLPIKRPPVAPSSTSSPKACGQKTPSTSAASRRKRSSKPTSQLSSHPHLPTRTVKLPVSLPPTLQHPTPSASLASPSHSPSPPPSGATRPPLSQTSTHAHATSAMVAHTPVLLVKYATSWVKSVRKTNVRGRR